jgi:hypothetical protein
LKIFFHCLFSTSMFLGLLGGGEAGRKGVGRKEGGRQEGRGEGGRKGGGRKEGGEGGRKEGGRQEGRGRGRGYKSWFKKEKSSKISQASSSFVKLVST